MFTSDNQKSENKERILKYLKEIIKQVENDENELEYVLVLKSYNDILHPVICFFKETTTKTMSSMIGFLEIMKNELIDSLIKQLK